jgi:two-component system sensor histidine kinase VicK
MPEIDSLQRYLGSALVRVAALQRRSNGTEQKTARALQDALTELQTALDELHAAHDEMRAWNAQMLEAQQQADAERTRYQRLFEALPDAFILTDEDGVILSANPPALALLNISPKYIAGKPLTVFVDRDRTGFLALIRAARDEAEPTTFEALLRPRERAPVAVAGRIIVMRDHEDAVVLGWQLESISGRRRTATKRSADTIVRDALEPLLLSLSREDIPADQLRAYVRERIERVLQDLESATPERLRHRARA